jgi:hypothetical protein
MFSASVQFAAMQDNDFLNLHFQFAHLASPGQFQTMEMLYSQMVTFPSSLQGKSERRKKKKIQRELFFSQLSKDSISWIRA